jgi:hypothetical protein
VKRFRQSFSLTISPLTDVPISARRKQLGENDLLRAELHRIYSPYYGAAKSADAALSPASTRSRALRALAKHTTAIAGAADEKIKPSERY